MFLEYSAILDPTLPLTSLKLVFSILYEKSGILGSRVLHDKSVD